MRLTLKVRATFNTLRDTWLQETRFTSHAQQIILHASYQQIIGMGPVVLPLIFDEMQRETGLWYWAAFCITRADPSEPDDSIASLRQHWLAWARDHGYLPALAPAPGAEPSDPAPGPS